MDYHFKNYMKKVKKILREYSSSLVYFVLLIWGIYDNDKAFILFNSVMILWTISSITIEKNNKEYTDYLEEERDKWYKKYIEEKYGKRSSDILENISKN